jgi:hypothetical protein
MAQAWVPPAGVGSVTVIAQAIDNTGHRLNDGSLLRDGKSTNIGLYAEVEYAFSDRISVSAGIPYILAKYRGPGPSPANLPVDNCRCWNRGWQDFGVTLRVNLANGVFGLTPSVSYGFPSHRYNYEGEAVVGRRLQELRVAVDAGGRLDVITPRLSVHGRYSYAFVETVLDIPNDRSNAILAAAVQVTRTLAARAMVSWQHTHGGLRFPQDMTTPELFRQHDRLLRDNNWRLGASVAYSWPRLDVFASFFEYMGGTNTHAGRVVTVGISWPFGID